MTPASCNKVGKRFRRRCIGKQPPDLIERGQLHHGRAVELAVVGGQPDLAGLFDDGLRHLHLAVVKVAQRAIGLDARDADERDVHLELADEVHRRLAHDAPVARAHHPASDDDLAFWVAAEDGGHVQVVGDDAQAPVVQQRLGNGLGGGADVQDQRAVVGHLFGHGARNAGFAIGVQGFALGVGQVLHRGAGHAHAAVKAGEQARFRQALHIAAHGLQRDPRVSASCSTVADLRARTSSSSWSWRGLVFTVGAGCVVCHRRVTNLKYLIRRVDGAFETVKRKNECIKGKP